MTVRLQRLQLHRPLDSSSRSSTTPTARRTSRTTTSCAFAWRPHGVLEHHGGFAALALIQRPWLQPINILAILELLALLLVTHGTPIVLERLFGPIGAQPIDGGVRFADGHPLLGPSKTWRGLLGAIAATSAVASLLGLGWWTGMLAASTAHAGDLFSSFTKRRWGIPSSGRAPLLDQLPEALLPAFALSGILGLGVLDIVVVAIAFMAVEIFLSPILYRLEIRDKPY